MLNEAWVCPGVRIQVCFMDDNVPGQSGKALIAYTQTMGYKRVASETSDSGKERKTYKSTGDAEGSRRQVSVGGFSSFNTFRVALWLLGGWEPERWLCSPG